MARKEMHHFGADLRFGSQFYRRDPSAYLNEFAGWNGQHRVGESSVWYLFSQQAAAELKAFNPEARAIVMLREPAEMLHSLYYSFRFDANEHLPTFEAALAAESDRRAGRNLAPQTYLAQGLVYRDTVRYTDQVKRYFEAFGRERGRDLPRLGGGAGDLVFRHRNAVLGEQFLSLILEQVHWGSDLGPFALRLDAAA